MILLPCPFLKQPVRLSAEREAYILGKHFHLVPSWRALVMQTLSEPDGIRWSARSERILIFGRWYPELLRGKHVLVIVVLDASGVQEPWIVTAFVARRPSRGAVAWPRS